MTAMASRSLDLAACHDCGVITNRAFDVECAASSARDVEMQPHSLAYVDFSRAPAKTWVDEYESRGRHRVSTQAPAPPTSRQLPPHCVQISASDVRPWVLFEVPDTPRLLREAAFWDVYYDHCSYFTLHPLERLFSSSGFQILSRSYESATSPCSSRQCRQDQGDLGLAGSRLRAV